MTVFEWTCEDRERLVNLMVKYKEHSCWAEHVVCSDCMAKNCDCCPADAVGKDCIYGASDEETLRYIFSMDVNDYLKIK